MNQRSCKQTVRCPSLDAPTGSTVCATQVRVYSESGLGAAMFHYHIRWSDSKPDWQAFKALEEALREAKRQLFRNFRASLP